MKNALLLSVACLTMLAMSGCCQVKITPMTARQVVAPMAAHSMTAGAWYYGSDDQYDYIKVLNLTTRKGKVPVTENLISQKDRYPFTSWDNGRRMYYNNLTKRLSPTYDKTVQGDIVNRSAIDNLLSSPR